MMTRKDYVSAAAIVKTQADAIDASYTVPRAGKLNDTVRTHLCSAFVAFFRSDNPRFDADRFREACGVK